MSLCPAVANGDVELVRVLLARGADPNELGSYMGQCAIEWAMHMLKKMTRSKDYDAVRNIFACVELCLDAGALPDGPPTDCGGIVGQGAKMGIPGRGNSREFSGIPGVRYFTPGERDLAAQ